MAGQKAYYATIKDVAKLAGTSTATVSYVLNGNTERVMSPQLRQRVLDAAHELHYTKAPWPAACAPSSGGWCPF